MIDFDLTSTPPVKLIGEIGHRVLFENVITRRTGTLLILSPWCRRTMIYWGTAMCVKPGVVSLAGGILLQKKASYPVLSETNLEMVIQPRNSVN